MATVRIHIDGEPFEAEAGGNLLRALLQAGRSLPHPCFHPALSAPASCRLCVAAADGPQGRELITTCNRVVTDGLALSLEAPEVAAARAALVDDLLLRHPADCAVCERAGECELQESVFSHHAGSTATTRSSEAQRVRIGPRLVLDRRRCILCTRCVRFGEEISGEPTLAVEGSGGGVRISACAGEPVGDAMSGNLLDLCPAGALIEPGERFAPPPWQLTGVSSVCAGCATGCTTRIDVHAGRVWRVKPRSEPGKEAYWLCDHGRYGWQEPPERLQAPRRDGQDIGWDAALADVAEAMEQSTRGAVLLSPYLTNEEAFLLIQLARRWKAELYLWEQHDAGGDRVYADGFMIHAGRGPNLSGVRAVAAATEATLGSAEALQDDLNGGVTALYAVGGSTTGEAAVLRVPEEVSLIAQDVCPTAMVADADLVLAGASAWTEKEGTFVNATARVHRVRAAVPPPGEARPDLWILSALWHGGPNRESADQLFSRLARTGQIPFVNLDYGVLERRADPATGVAFGGGWSSWLQQRDLVPVEDHVRRS